MGLHARTWFTPKQRAELWERWRSGQCVADIARALERKNKSGVYRVLALSGGIAPLPRRRAAQALRLAEREEILRGIAAGWSMRQIAQNLGRSPSTMPAALLHSQLMTEKQIFGFKSTARLEQVHDGHCECVEDSKHRRS